MARRSVFYEEWRDCLRAHYLYVVRNNDRITEPTLRVVLQDAGITQSEIESWHQEALAQREQDNAQYSHL